MFGLAFKILFNAIIKTVRTTKNIINPFKMTGVCGIYLGILNDDNIHQLISSRANSIPLNFNIVVRIGFIII